jgi:WD40 repeat protein/transcriptional regulator with XRE-family HTH domain
MQKRKRGVVLTPKGLQKFREARYELEFQDNFGKRFTLEELSQRTNLDPLTIRKVLSGSKGVDKRTLEALFNAFNIHLCESYFSTPDPNKRQDWGEAVSASAFYGRTQELDILDEWLLADRCRLITILGMGGVGKTRLSIKLTELMRDRFDCIVWRSLCDSPPLDTLLVSIGQFLTDAQKPDIEQGESISEKISRVIDYLKEMRCLIVLDNVDTVLRGGKRAGRYRPGYEDYGEFLERIGESEHQSCLLLTTREKPKEVASLEGEALPVRTLRLTGLKEGEGEEILKSKRLRGSEAEFTALVKRYAGNALALKIVATTISDLFDGHVSEFLYQETTVFGDIRDLLDQHFERLSDLETQLMYWLAINREPVTLSKLREDLVSPIPQFNLLETLESLGRRSLIETATPTLNGKDVACFRLEPVVMEYMTSRLIEQICEEITEQKFALFRSHTLIQATAKDYIREAQICFILQPVIDRLLLCFQGQKNLENQLTQILLTQREESLLEPGYVGGNVLNLLKQLGTDLTGYDFSCLTIRQADLQNVSLQNTNFAYVNLEQCTFTEAFTAIHAIAFSSDGNLLALGDSNGEIHVYQVTDVKRRFTCKGHVSWITALAFSPDNKVFASSSTDSTIKLWDINTGQCLRTLEGHTNEVWSIAFSHDNCTLASGSHDCTIKLWNTHTGKCFKTLQEHTGWVFSVAFIPQCDINSGSVQLLSGSDDQTVKLWDIKTGQCLKTFQEHQNGIRSIALNPQGRILATGSEDCTVKLWNVQTGECFRTLEGHRSRVFSVAFSLQNNLLASSGDDQTVKLWDADTGQCLRTLEGHSSQIFSVAFNPQNSLLASGGHDQTVKLWSVNTGQCFRTLKGYTNQILSVAFTPENHLLASGNCDGKIRLWDVSTGLCLKVLQGHSNWVHSVVFNPQGNTLASGSGDRTIKLWDTYSGHTLGTLEGHGSGIMAIAFSPNGQTLASGSEDHTIKLWDVLSGQTLSTLRGHNAVIWAVAFLSQGELLASGSWDQTIRLWDVNTGHCFKTLTGHSSSIRALAVSPDGETLASASPDQTIRLWHAYTGECLKILHVNTAWLQAIAFSPDGKILASTSHDNTVKLWDIHTGKSLGALHGHEGLVWSLAFGQNIPILASGGEDETIKLWNLEANQSLKSMRMSKPYEQMNIVGARGLTDEAIVALTSLGAVSQQPHYPYD